MGFFFFEITCDRILHHHLRTIPVFIASAPPFTIVYAPNRCKFKEKKITENGHSSSKDISITLSKNKVLNIYFKMAQVVGNVLDKITK